MVSYEFSVQKDRDQAVARSSELSDSNRQLRSQINDLSNRLDKLNGAMRDTRTTSGMLAGAANSTPGSSGAYKISLQNDCSHASVKVAVRYQNPEGTWITRGWWNLKPASTSQTDIESKNSIFYFYAVGDGLTWRGQDKGLVGGGSGRWRLQVRTGPRCAGA